MVLIDPAEIERRCAAIRLQKKELAWLAGRHLNTVVNLLKGRGSRADTLDAIGGVLVAEELRLRDYLLLRHPLASRSDVETATGASPLLVAGESNAGTGA